MFVTSEFEIRKEDKPYLLFLLFLIVLYIVFVSNEQSLANLMDYFQYGIWPNTP